MGMRVCGLVRRESLQRQVRVLGLIDGNPPEAGGARRDHVPGLEAEDTEIVQYLSQITDVVHALLRSSPSRAILELDTLPRVPHARSI
jgi:hypothetical protein